MDNSFEKLDEVFNVSGEIEIVDNLINDNKISKNNEIYNSNINDIKTDYEYTRGNLYSIIEKGQEALNGMLQIAQETEQSRAFEVVGQLIKTVSDATDKLMELQKKKKEIEEDKGSLSTTNVTNALFIGSTAELSKLLKSEKNNNKDK